MDIKNIFPEKLYTGAWYDLHANILFVGRRSGATTLAIARPQAFIDGASHPTLRKARKSQVVVGDFLELVVEAQASERILLLPISSVMLDLVKLLSISYTAALTERRPLTILPVQPAYSGLTLNYWIEERKLLNLAKPSSGRGLSYAYGEYLLDAIVKQELEISVTRRALVGALTVSRGTK